MQDRLLLPLSFEGSSPQLCPVFFPPCEVSMVAEWGVVMPQGLRLRDSYIFSC